MHTLGSFAVGKEFIAARFLVVLPDSSHYDDLRTGVIKVSYNKDKFIQAIQKNIYSSNLLTLSKQLENLYKHLNHNNLINEHIKLYKKIIKN